MATVLIVVHPERDEAADAANELARRLTDLAVADAHRVIMSRADAERAAVATVDGVDVPESLTAPVDGVDLAVSIGGDGTMLHTTALVAGSPTPVLGVNCGRLGYLTEVEIDQAADAVADVLSGDAELEERMRIRLEVVRADGSVDGPWTALNEGVVEKREQGHTVHLAVDFDGHPFMQYSADGLIVATPTGSTAYSMSARGPIVEPTHRAVLFTPVSPHTLFDRSLVLDPSTAVRITVASERPATLSVDGGAEAHLSEGDTVVATAAEQSTLLVRTGTRRFHDVLRTKFGLPANVSGLEPMAARPDTDNRHDTGEEHDDVG